MRLTGIFGILLTLYLCRYFIVGIAYVAIGGQIVDTLGLIYEAKVNHLYAYFGAKEPYLLPARTQNEGQTTLALSPTWVTTTRKDTTLGTRYAFQATGTIENRGPWPVDSVGVICYYRTGYDDGEGQVTASTPIEVKPGETHTYAINLKTDRLEDKSGISSVECKPWGHIKGAWAGYPE